MARFYGEVGYGVTVEDPPESGVWKDVITEIPYFGDVVQNARQLVEGDKVNDDISVTTSISIVADPYGEQNYLAMRYVRWAGALWVVSTVDVESPRLILRLGGIYNGPTPGTGGSS